MLAVTLKFLAALQSAALHPTTPSPKGSGGCLLWGRFAFTLCWYICSQHRAPWLLLCDRLSRLHTARKLCVASSHSRIRAPPAQTRDDSWDFKADGLDGWDSRSGGSRGRSQDLDGAQSTDRLPSVGEAMHGVDTSAADERFFTKVCILPEIMLCVAPRSTAAHM